MGTCLFQVLTFILLLTAAVSNGSCVGRDEFDEIQAFPSVNEPDPAALMAVGTRVVRGKDWKWNDQDGGSGGKGTVISPGVFPGWVSVRWDDGATYSYRMGDGGKYDLSLADDYSSLKDGDTTFTSSAPLSGPEIVDLMKVGTRVVRGKDWIWYNQDGGRGGKGTVTGIGVYKNWVTVEWDTGDSYNYRMGDRGHYDLSLADALSLSDGITTTIPETKQTVTLRSIATEETTSAATSTSSEGRTSSSTTTTVEMTSESTTTTTEETTSMSTTTTTEAMTSTLSTSTQRPMSTSTSTLTTDSVQESNQLFGQLVAKELSSVPKKGRIQTLQDILEVFKRIYMGY